jgi:hypothetical protein
MNEKSQADRVDELVAESLRALHAAGQVPPAERFERMVKSGLIRQDGQLNRDHAEEVPVSEITSSHHGR